MTDTERRGGHAAPATPAELRAALDPQQRRTLDTMEQLGWRLRFVRRPLFQAPVPVLFAADGDRWVVLEPDGSIDEHPDFPLREA